MAEPIPQTQNRDDNQTKTAIYNARNLVGSKNEAKIVLDDQEYFLRITKQNKLILTK